MQEKSTLLLIQNQRSGIDAITQSCRFWSILKNMAQMCVTFLAQYFRSLHEQTVICFRIYAFLIQWFPEAGPTGAGIVFGVRIKKCISTANTKISPFGFGIIIFSGERAFCSLVSANLKLFFRQLFLPLLIAF